MPWPTGVMTKPNCVSLKMLGLGLKLHVVNCEQHPDEKILEYYDGDTTVNFEIEQPLKIFERLANSLYMRHSAILILLNCYCSCRTEILQNILKAIKSNKNIKYKLKLIYAVYNLRGDFAVPDKTKIWKNYFEKHVNKILKDKLQPIKAKEGKLKNLNDLLDDYVIDNQNITFNDKEPLKDYFNFKSHQLENVVLFQNFVEDKHGYERGECMDQVLFVLDCLPLISAQELPDLVGDINYIMPPQSQANAELYFYSVNPALAIINNSYIFTNQQTGCSVREGSQKDVLKWLRELKIARIPYILTEDYSRHQLLDLVKYLKNKNLKSFKSLMFITMTHGSSNNIIYTHDGELNFISDILGPIQSNPSLNQTSISFVNVQCRGRLNAEISTPDEFDEIQPTQIAELQPNTSVFYSVPDSVISPRRPHIGTPFVQSFCKSFRELNCATDVQTLCENTCNDLKNDQYYAYLDCFDKSSELIVGDSTRLHCIKPTPTSAKDVLSDFEKLEEELHDLNQLKRRNKETMKSFMDLVDEHRKRQENKDMPVEIPTTTRFCLCANVNEKKFGKNVEELNYFSSALDEDSCFVEENK